MTVDVVTPRIRGFICTNAHPEGCAAEVARQIAHVRRDPSEWPGGNLLVLGSSAGYGLATRIAGAFGYGMDSVGVFYERPATDARTATAGWYNTVAFTEAAKAAGLEALNLNGDAFSAEVLEAALDAVRRIGPLDYVVYSLAAPARTDPVTGETYRSVLKAVGQPVTMRTADMSTGVLGEITLEPATPEEIAGTVAVMGGADLERWTLALLREGLLAKGARVVAYSYIGPELTWPIYHHGTIGHAKADLERTCRRLDARLQEAVGGHCWVSVNKSMVTQAAAAIPSVPLYISFAYKVMKEHGVHEGTIEQIDRLFRDHLGPGREPRLDAEGRIRIDDLELRDDVQAAIEALWSQATSANVADLADIDEYQLAFRRLFGFDVPGVDYDRPVEIDRPMP